MAKWRINFIFLFFILCAAAIIGCLFYIQVVGGDRYKALAQGQQNYFQILRGNRGEIFFSGGQAMAIDVYSKYAFISPARIEDKDKAVGALSQALNIAPELISEKMSSSSQFELVKSDLSKEEENALKEARLPGAYANEKILRRYPQGSMASQVAGFVGGEGIGQYGVEGYYEDVLRSKEYFPKKEGGFAGHGFVQSEERSASGQDIYLTIDYNIQFMAEKLLEEARNNLNIESGQIIVMEPSSGKILALANSPSFDPNNYADVKDFMVFQNSAIQKFYEPGSAFKPITMAAALDQGKITPQTTYVDEGAVKIGGLAVYNFDQRVWGQKTMTQVLENSINTGAVFAERAAGHEMFLDYLAKFGFFEPTGIDLQGEVFSENAEFKKGYEINFATAAFGQGIEITPIQLVRAFSAIANGGKLMKPYLADKVFKNGKIVESSPAVVRDNVISSKTASELSAMMVSVVEKGSGKAAKIPGYYIAGKTGTAQVSFSALDINKKGYSDKTWQSFIGFAPAFNARFVILVKLDDPAAKTAEYSAVPIFKELAKYIIDYLEIPPDYE